MHESALGAEAGRRLAARLARERQVGDLLKLDYSEATIVVHDRLRRDVGGLPLGCFLIATRVEPGSAPDPDREDTSFVLLRVLGPSPLPNHIETDRDRFEAAKRAADRAQQWDDQTTTDQFTLNLLRFAGLRCRILGTFLLKPNAVGDWDLTFGADLANFYSGRGMKVYKPDGQTLADIVNFVRPQPEARGTSGHRIEIGRVRYAASERSGDDTAATRVDLDPADLLARRTALFGMSRTGKSNTTKIIAAAVFGLRANAGLRVGQLILDPNGEYANDNAQDAGSLRGIAGKTAGSLENDIVTYGLHPHPNDPGRRIIKLNFFGNEPQDWRNRDQVVSALTALVQGKEILDNLLSDQSSQYISAFRMLRLDPPADWDDSTRTRYMRLVSAYRALLSAHLQPPTSLSRGNLAGLTNDDLRRALGATQKYATAATVFAQSSPVHWDEARNAWNKLGQAIADTASGYGTFNQSYAAKKAGRSWHDEPLLAVLKYLDQPGGMRLVSRLKEYHSPMSTTDYAADVVEDLRAGRLVIVDQSTGDPDMNKAAAERLMWRVFDRQRQDFVQPRRDEKSAELIPPPDLLVYVEEAHNLLPAKADDLTTIWSRIAKEGSKFRIGLAYATQEPSSIQSNILKNTDNWFAAHLNNADELRELKKYYDFEDFSHQILAVPEPGFLRMRTLSNPYTVPVQIDRFAT